MLKMGNTQPSCGLKYYCNCSSVSLGSVMLYPSVIMLQLSLNLYKTFIEDAVYATGESLCGVKP